MTASCGPRSRCFRRHGYAKFNLSDVAAQAGISRPTLYKSFSSKDDLLAAFSEFEMRTRA